MRVHRSVRWFAAASVMLALFVMLAHGQHILIPVCVILLFICGGICLVGALLHLMFS